MHPGNSLPAALERWTVDGRQWTENGGRETRGQRTKAGGQKAGCGVQRTVDGGRLSTAILGRGLVALLVVAMATLSVRSSPRVAEFLWLPDVVADWTNRYGVLRNTPAFGFLALVVGLLTGSRKRRVWGYLGVAGFALLCEVVQLWIPTRYCDVRDVAAGWVGVALAAAVVELSRLKAVGGKR